MINRWLIAVRCIFLGWLVFLFRIIIQLLIQDVRLFLFCGLLVIRMIIQCRIQVNRRVWTFLVIRLIIQWRIQVHRRFWGFLVIRTIIHWLISDMSLTSSDHRLTSSSHRSICNWVKKSTSSGCRLFSVTFCIYRGIIIFQIIQSDFITKPIVRSKSTAEPLKSCTVYRSLTINTVIRNWLICSGSWYITEFTSPWTYYMLYRLIIRVILSDYSWWIIYESGFKGYKTSAHFWNKY